jgi:hypothetical protein
LEAAKQAAEWAASQKEREEAKAQAKQEREQSKAAFKHAEEQVGPFVPNKYHECAGSGRIGCVLIECHAGKGGNGYSWCGVCQVFLACLRHSILLLDESIV